MRDWRESRRGGGRATVRLFADASPKPGHTGLGLAVKNAVGDLIAWQGKRIGPMTCNEAEYAAIVFALEYAWQKKVSLDVRRVLVLSDSKVVIEQMQGLIAVNNPSLRKWHSRARALASQFSNIRFEHIPREHNELADAMAEEASRESEIGSAKDRA